MAFFLDYNFRICVPKPQEIAAFCNVTNGTDADSTSSQSLAVPLEIASFSFPSNHVDWKPPTGSYNNRKYIVFLNSSEICNNLQFLTAV